MEQLELLRRSGSDEDQESDHHHHHHQDLEAEQGEALLSSENGPAPKKEQGWFGERTTRSPVRSFGLLTILLIILAALVYLVASHGPCIYGMRAHSCPSKSPTTPSEAVKATSFRRPQSDYRLDPKWNIGAKSTTRRYHFTVTDEEANPDGVYRQMILINGQFPGPLIECNEGDRLVIEIENRGVNATAFHWHGLFQNASNWMDGTVGVTQCPIAPGSNFTYDFTIKGQHGTYWYHSHHGLQAADGLVGPLVIHSPKEKEYQKLKYASDRVVLLQDHYHDLSGALLPQYLANDRENNEPVPDGALINGANIRDCSTVPGRRCDSTNATLPRLDLEPNKNHRLRVINAATLASFQFEIDSHSFAVTEVDGTDVLPSPTKRIKINPAQRYSVILTSNITTTKSFWLRLRLISDCFSGLNTPFANPNIVSTMKGIIHYGSSTATTALPTTQAWNQPIEQECVDMDLALIPIPPISPPAPDHKFNLVANFPIGNWRLSRGFFNDSSWRPNPHSPTLSRFIDGYQSSNASFTSSLNGANKAAFPSTTEMVLQVDGIKTIDVVIQNLNEGPHPMHLHGYKFWVMKRGRGFFNPSTYDGLDVSNPLRRDTAVVDGYGWMLLRFVTDNPGLWAFHCHLAWHSEAGLQMQFLTRPDVVGTWKLPKANADLCSAAGIEKGMAPDDSIYFGNFG